MVQSYIACISKSPVKVREKSVYLSLQEQPRKDRATFKDHMQITRDWITEQKEMYVISFPRIKYSDFITNMIKGNDPTLTFNCWFIIATKRL